jgi:hypothetical protein
MKQAPVTTRPRLLDLRLAAAYFSVGTQTIEDWIQDGIITPVPMPGSIIQNKAGNVIAHAKTRRIANFLLDRCDLD